MKLQLLAFALIGIGIGLLLLSMLKEGKTEGGFVGFIGPVPIGFASRKEFLFLALALASIIFAFFLLLFK